MLQTSKNITSKLHHPLYNPDDVDCIACNSLSQTYLAANSFNHLYLNNEAIEGAYSNTKANGLSLNVVDVCIAQSMTMAGNTVDDDYCLGVTYFCSGDMSWFAPSGHEFSYNNGDLLLSQKRPTGICHMHPGQRIRFVELAIGKKNPLLKSEIFLSDTSYLYEVIMAYKLQSVVHDILDGCSRDILREAHHHAKMLELYTLVVDAVYEAKENFNKVSLSEDWTKRLFLAKKIIDVDIAEAPSLAKLSRQVLLNEYKLKTGFKKLFGLPVHAYIIEQRLQKAMELLQNSAQSVTQIANSVGYSELGRFAVTFRKKYGVSPSQVRRGINIKPLQ